MVNRFMPHIASFVLLSLVSSQLLIGASRPATRLVASPLATEIDKLTTAVEPELIQWRRHLHQNPELSNREVETAKYIVERLRSFGLEPQTGVARNGVIALLRGGGLVPSSRSAPTWTGCRCARR